MANRVFMNRFVCEIKEEMAVALKELFEVSGWVIDQPQYTFFRAKEGKTSCSVYSSGKLVVQGKGTEELLNEFIAVVAPELMPPTEEEKEESAAEFVPHIGIDESGKGDYFGPLVTAAVYVDERSRRQLLELGVQDSKRIKSDKKMRELAANIKKICAGSWSIVAIGNEKYNELYDRMGNLNRMLAWCHATVLENVLEKVPSCKLAISDQFAKDKRTVASQLKQLGQRIELIQMTKAESDVAVAAASIIARAEFVDRIERMSLGLKLTENLPKGASPKVKSVAMQLYQQLGEGAFFKYVKKHFRTTEEITGKIH